MAEAHLNSIHLDDFRREEFRRARERLLKSRGMETIHAQARDDVDFSYDHTGLDLSGKDAPPKNMKFYLKDHDAVYPLKVGVNTIGRMPDNDVVIEDGHVSRRHCAVLVHSKSDCEIYDVASKNGTFINGSRIAGSVRLSSGDEIRMCDHAVIFFSQADSTSGLFPSLLPTQ